MATISLEKLTDKQKEYLESLPDCIKKYPEAAMLITEAEIGDVVRINLHDGYSKQTGRGDLGIWIIKTEEIPEAFRHKTRTVKSLVGHFSAWDGYVERCVKMGSGVSPEGHYSTMFTVPVSAIDSYHIIERRES